GDVQNDPAVTVLESRLTVAAEAALALAPGLHLAGLSVVDRDGLEHVRGQGAERAHVLDWGAADRAGHAGEGLQSGEPFLHRDLDHFVPVGTGSNGDDLAVDVKIG